MLQIALLLCGRRFIGGNRYLLTAAGLMWGLFGFLVLADGMLGARYFPLGLFGWFLLCESLLTLVASSGATGLSEEFICLKVGLLEPWPCLFCQDTQAVISSWLSYWDLSVCCPALFRLLPPGWYVIRTGDARWLAGCVRSCMRYSFSSPIPLIMMERFLSSSGR